MRELVSTNYHDFLERYYREAIIGLAGCYPGTKTLYIDFNDLDRYDMNAADRLLKNPDTELELMSGLVCESLNTLTADEHTDIAVSVKNLPRTERTPIHQIGSDHVGKLIAIEGRITKATQRYPKLLIGAFKCQRCEYTTYIPRKKTGALNRLNAGTMFVGERAHSGLFMKNLTWLMRSR